MSEVINIEIKVSDFLNDSRRMDALQAAIKRHLESSSTVNGIVGDFIKKDLATETEKLKVKIGDQIAKTYGSDAAIEKIVKDNDYQIRRIIGALMKEQTKVLEAHIVKAMIADGFAKRIAQKVEEEVSNKIKNVLTSYGEE